MESEITLRETSTLTGTSPRVKNPPKKNSINVPFIYTPSDDGTDENLLVLLHGLGAFFISIINSHSIYSGIILKWMVES